MKKLILIIFLVLISLSYSCFAITKTYNFNSTYEGINMWAYGQDRNQADAPPPSFVVNNYPYDTNITLSAELDSIDNSAVGAWCDSSDSCYHIFQSRLNEPKSAINSINWTYVLRQVNSLVDEQVNLYQWNYTSSSWSLCEILTQYSEDDIAHCYGGLDVINNSNDLIILAYMSTGNAEVLETDFVKLEITYNDNPPFYSNLQNNASGANGVKINVDASWNITVNDAIGLSGYIFAHNNTGTLTNGSYKSISGTSKFVNETATITKGRGNYICGQFWLNDTYGNVNQTLITELGACFTVNNSAPTLKTDLTFKNSSAGHRFNATATFTDNDGTADIISRTIENSSGYCDYNSNTTLGNNITIKYNCSGIALTSTIIRINLTDSGSQVVSTSQLTNVFPNQAPTMTSVSLNKTTNVIDTDDLNCSAVGKADADNDITVYHYEWYNNSIAMGIDNVKLSNTNLSGLGTWYCEAWVNDSYSISSKYTSSNVIIGSSEVSPSITTINATTNNLLSDSTNPTNNNSNINFSILFSDINTNLWTSYICSTPTALDCFNNVSGSILCKSESNLSSTVLSCNYPTDGYAGANPRTVYGFVLDNMTLYSTSSTTTFEINYPANAPVLVAPSINTYTNTNYMQINWSATDPDSDTINSTLYINSILIYNGTEKGFNYSALAEYATYIWQVFTKDQHGYGINNISLGNWTTDYTNPNLTITSPASTTYNTATVSLTINATDFAISICNYSLYYKDSGTLKESNNISCQSTTILAAPFYTGGYQLKVYAYDKAGNINQSEINFTTQAAAIPPSQGGGAAPPEDDELTQCTSEVKWSILSAGSNDKVDTSLILGSNKTTDFIIKVQNNGFTNKTITLTCINTGEVDICPYVDLGNKTYTIPPNPIEASEIRIKVRAPVNTTYEEQFMYSIKAEDECYQTLPIVSIAPSRYSITGRWIPIGSLSVPIFALSLAIAFIGFLILFIIFMAADKPYFAWEFGLFGGLAIFASFNFIIL